ncbi:response regulator [Haoranjiania flava]|uniref:Response regulator transcription factor n=1 Tax=Haoranjiania flava TaxID=1856322 RepID=A0AAE3LL15_9BACT|nr:response regulator transcription factor [Haoranjiania flava]MCU7695158.1 response regulator transcription factor [Haoranjiania flava]
MSSNLDTLINVCIIEDDEVIRQGYKTLLEEDPGYFVSGSYASFEEAYRLLKDDCPDIILLDVQLPGMRGVDAIPLIKKILPEVFILIITVYENEEIIFCALKNGASGYITKDTPFGKIKESIREIINGGGVMSANIAKQVIKSFERNLNSPLSKREIEILEQISEGKSRTRIAAQLFIDLETVKSHIKNIYSKLDVNCREDAIRIARNNKYI